MGRSPLIRAAKTNLLCFWLSVQRGSSELCPDPGAQRGQGHGSLLPFLLLQADAPSEQNQVIRTHENDLRPRLREPSPLGQTPSWRGLLPWPDMLLQFGAHPDPSTPTHVALCSWGDALATITQPLLAACFVCRVGSIRMQQNQGAALPTANLFPATTSSSKQEGREGVMLSAQTDPLHTPNLPRTQPHPPAARYPVPTAPCCSRLRFFQQSSSDGRETHSFAGAPRDARISCIRCSLVREGTREAPRQCLGLKGPPAGDVREGCGQTHTSSPLPPQRSLWSGSRHGANKSGTGQIMQERWMEGEGEKDGREEVC